MTCPRCNADSESVAEHGSVCECGACGYQWSSYGGHYPRDGFDHDTGERCEPSYPRWTPGSAKPWE